MVLEGDVLRCWRVWCWNVLDCGMSECAGRGVGWYCICVKVLDGLVLEGARMETCWIVRC